MNPRDTVDPRHSDRPVVTVYITNYNYGRYLDQAIQSVLGQTFQDFELIIIDDGSTDDSRTILERYETSEGIFIIRQENKGLIAANNIAVKVARGNYIMRLDADDYLDPRALEIMVSTLERDPQAALVFPDYYEVDDHGAIIRHIRRHDFEKDVALFDLPAHGACTMIRRDILSEVGGYDEAFTRQDGYDLWLKVVGSHRVKNVNLPLFFYRQHATNLTRDERQLLKTRSDVKAKHVKTRELPPLVILTVVPVRGNLADPRSMPLASLGNKKLIDWTLDAALGSELVSGTLVTTPDQAVIAHVNERYGDRVLTLQRSPELARINVGTEQSALEALDVYRRNHPQPDALLLLYIEAPFRSSLYVDKIINTMQLFDVDIVDGVRLDDSLFYYHDGNGLRPWRSSTRLRLEREDLFRRVGGIHLIRREFLEQEREMIGGKIGHITLDQKAAFVIRTELDWKLAQSLADVPDD